MIRDVAAKRYAEASYKIALEQGTIDGWVPSIQAMAVAFADPEMARIIDSARVSTEKKLWFVDQVLGEVEPLALNLARLLVVNSRTVLASQIAEAFQELVDRDQGVAHALVKSAIPLSDSEKETIAKRLGEISGQKIDITVELNESILGGLVARIGDQLIDGSTRSKLESLRRRLQAAQV